MTNYKVKIYLHIKSQVTYFSQVKGDLGGKKGKAIVKKAKKKKKFSLVLFSYRFLVFICDTE